MILQHQVILKHDDGTDSGGTLGYFSLPTPGTGTVTSVSVVSANGFAGTVATATSTPAITISTTITGILQGNGTAISAATTGDLTDAGTDGITITNGTGAVLGTGTSIAQHVADTTHNGYLSSTDWNTFNGKQASGNYITALTGDVTATGPGSVAATLATVNANVGSFGSSTAIPSFTVNGKGLITAASTNAVVAPAGTLTGTTLASNVVTSSLTTVGTIGTGVWNGTTIDVPHGGTNNTSFTAYSIIAAGTTSTGAFQNVSGVGTTGQVLTSNGASALPTWQAATGGTLTAPTITKFSTSTSGTYTTPTSPSPLYLRVIAVGAGAGGGNSGTTIGTLATNGGNTTFGSSLVTANGGVAGTWSNTNGGAGGSGGSGTLGAGAIGFKANGNPGASGWVPSNSSATVPGAVGGSSVLGGGGLAAQGNATGGAGIDGCGGGGGGAGLSSVGGTAASGGGGGAISQMAVENRAGRRLQGFLRLIVPRRNRERGGRSRDQKLVDQRSLAFAQLDRDAPRPPSAGSLFENAWAASPAAPAATAFIERPGGDLVPVPADEACATGVTISALPRLVMNIARVNVA